jgi:Uma2 family endonuclease
LIEGLESGIGGILSSAMSTQPKSHLTPEQYLQIERRADFRSEYFQGEMFAMSGAREPHLLVVTALVALLYGSLKGRCRVYSNDMRVLVSPTGLYTYPDIVVVCGKPNFLDDELDTLTNPTLLIEVLSPSTESYDRGKKFDHYRTIESLQQYLLVSTDRPHVDSFTRSAGVWTFSAADGLNSELVLGSVGSTLRLDAIYADVEF